LVELSTLLAPFTPFLADALYRNLVCEVNPGAPQSVHLTDFPEGDPNLVDPRLSAGMAAARELASLGHSARSDAKVKVRQPLGRAVLLVPPDLRDAVEDVAELLADELNVDELSFAEEVGALVQVRLRPNYAVAGPELGARVRQLGETLSSLEPDQAESTASILEDGQEVDVDLPDGTSVRVALEHVEIRREPAAGTAFAYEPPFGVSLDLAITPDLRREGLAREFIHQVQTLRRDLGLEVTDRIRLAVDGPEEVLGALREHEDYVTEELLATALEAGEPGEDARAVSIDGTEVRVVVRRA
jgi:isoleucyl-tRNA synthetase